MRRKIALLLCLVMLTGLFAGCTGTDTKTQGSSDDITIKFLHKWPNQKDNDYFVSAIAKFEEANPGVKVSMDSAGDEAMKDKIRVVMGTTEQPDVFFSWSGEFAKNFIREGNVLDLTPYLEADPEWRDSIMMAGLEPFMEGGKYYGIPYRINGKFFVYNKRIFEENNLSEPKTWSEFLSVLETIKGTGVAPIGLGNIYPWAACHYITGLNQKCVPEDVRHDDYIRETGEYTDPGYIKALEHFKELNDKGYFQEGVNSTEHNMALEMFYGEKVAMVYVELEEFGDFDEKFEGEWGFFPMPAIEDGAGNQNFLTGAPDGFMVSSRSANPDEAVAFLKFLTTLENSSEMVQTLGWPSPVEGAVNSENSPASLVAGLEAVSKAEGMALWLDTDIDIRISDVYLPALQELLNNDKTPEQIMKEVQEISERIKAE